MIDIQEMNKKYLLVDKNKEIIAFGENLTIIIKYQRADLGEHIYMKITPDKVEEGEKKNEKNIRIIIITR